MFIGFADIFGLPIPIRRPKNVFITTLPNPWVVEVSLITLSLGLGFTAQVST
jgi:hypothetical protein